mgnify:CR=1 FL=1
MFQENQEIDVHIKQRNEFFRAIRSGNIVEIESCLASGMDIHVTDIWGSTALLIACENKHETVVMLLLKNGANINQATEENDNSPLISVCSNGNTTIALLLLDAGAEINQTDSVGRTPLFYACWFGHTEIARLLVHRGADIQKATDTQATPLYIACQDGHKEIVKLLLAHDRSTINQEEENGQTPLFIACSQGHEAVVQLLLVAGADIQKAIIDGYTPLYVACYHKHVSITESLIASNKFAGYTPEQLKEIIYSSARSYYANDIIFKDMLYFSVVCYRCHRLLGTDHHYDETQTKAIRAGELKYNSQTKILLSIFKKGIETIPREICQEVVNYLPLVWLNENSQTPTNN